MGAPGRDTRPDGELISFLHSFHYASEGIAYVLRTQRNARVHLLIGVLAIVAGLYFRIATTEWAVMVTMIGLVFGAEMFNTVIELTIDLAVQGFDPRAKAAKDASAGAVLIVAIAAVGVGIAIFAPRLWALAFGARLFAS